jgi:hypothetical protein
VGACGAGGACGGINSYDGTHDALTRGGNNRLKGGDGRSQVEQCDTRGDQSDGDDIDTPGGRGVTMS